MRCIRAQFAEPRAGTPAESFPAFEQGETPIATQHHMAYRAESLEHLRTLREQVKGALRSGCFKCAYVPDDAAPHDLISPIIDHGFCYSCYFRDPTTGLFLEICHTVREMRSTAGDEKQKMRNPTTQIAHCRMITVDQLAVRTHASRPDTRPPRARTHCCIGTRSRYDSHAGRQKLWHSDACCLHAGTGPTLPSSGRCVRTKGGGIS